MFWYVAQSLSLHCNYLLAKNGLSHHIQRANNCFFHGKLENNCKRWYLGWKINRVFWNTNGDSCKQNTWLSTITDVYPMGVGTLFFHCDMVSAYHSVFRGIQGCVCVCNIYITRYIEVCVCVCIVNCERNKNFWEKFIIATYKRPN